MKPFYGGQFTFIHSVDKIHCKTVRIFAYSSTREHSNKRSGTRLKTESETGETPRFTDFFTDVEKKNPTVLQSIDKTNLCVFHSHTQHH